MYFLFRTTVCMLGTTVCRFCLCKPFWSDWLRPHGRTVPMSSHCLQSKHPGSRPTSSELQTPLEHVRLTCLLTTLYPTEISHLFIYYNKFLHFYGIFFELVPKVSFDFIVSWIPSEAEYFSIFWRTLWLVFCSGLYEGIYLPALENKERMFSL